MAEDKKKWFLLSLVIILTAALIVIFRFKDLGRLVKEQKTNLANFYTANLRPLLTQISITNDDIFNFAFHKRLPLNYEKNKFLVLGNEKNGTGYFAFAENLPDGTENYDEFKGKLNLNKEQKAKVDSILDSYRGKIEEQVLINDKNTIAVNSGLWNLNRAILADILSYASKVSNSKLKQMIPSSNTLLKDPSLYSMITHVKAVRDTNYILVTPDSVFDVKYNFDMKKYNRDMAHLDKNLQNLDKKINSINLKIRFSNDFVEKNKKAGKDFNVQMDTNLIKINVPKELSIPIPLPNMDEIADEISSSLGNIGPSEYRRGGKLLQPKKPLPLRIKVNDPDNREKLFELNINIPDIDSIIHANLKILDTLNFNFDLNLDEQGEKTAKIKNPDFRKMHLLNSQLTKIINKLKEHPEKAAELQKEIDGLNKELNQLYSKDKE